MSANAAPPNPASPGPIAPPDEQFWEKYSPHYEFPLSSVGSVLMNVGILAVFLISLWLLARSSMSDKVAPPIRALNVAMGDAEAGIGSRGSGGGEPKENVDVPIPTEPSQPVPEAVLKDVKDENKKWLPVVPDAPDAPKVEDLPAVKNLAKLNDDIRKKLQPGAGGGPGSGTQGGKGDTGEPGTENGGKGDASSSASRTLRWVIDFKTKDAADYRAQLLPCKAILAFPYPDKSLKAFKDLGAARPTATPFDKKEIPGIYFIDEDNAGAMARELGLDFRPTYFICFFPKDIEDDLAAKEYEYRLRKESEIFSTTFSIVIRDGKPTIRVTAQDAVRR